MTGAAVGPFVTSVFLSMVSTEAEENVPSAERSNVTTRGSPGPLLSVPRALCRQKMAKQEILVKSEIPVKMGFLDGATLTVNDTGWRQTGWAGHSDRSKT